MSAGLTRRAALSGAVASVAVVGVAAAAAMPAIVSSASWNRALATWAAAAAKAETSGENDDYDAEAEAACDLLMMPAPHVEAIHWKLDYLWGSSANSEYCDSYTTRWTNALIADARRLAKMEG